MQAHIANLDYRYKLDKARIVTELKNERPQWIISAYGPEKELPVQLFGGYPREQSFEELRLRHYELAAAGNPQQAVQEAQAWFNNAEQQIRTALDDVEGAIKYMINGENEHPNRFDICKAKGGNLNNNPQGLVGSQPSGPAFGQPSSALAAPKASFAGPATSFTQPTGTLGFGQPSALGSQPPSFGQQAGSSGQSSGFGPPTQLGRPTTSFGQPSSRFGHSSAQAPAFGKPSNPTSAFGQPSVPTPAFGKQSFGQPSAPSAFGQKPAATAFGAPSALGSKQQSAFSQPSAPQKSAFGQQSSGISQPSAFGKPSSAPTNPFGQPSQTSVPSQPTAFGNPSSASSNLFGQPRQPAATSAFGQATPVAANPFSRPSANQSTSAFGQPSTSGNPYDHSLTQPPKASVQKFTQPTSGFGGPSASSMSTAVSQSANVPAASKRVQVSATRDAQGKLRTWKGNPVTYVDNEPCTKGRDGAWEKICFPDGPPALVKAVELADEAYDESTKENYTFMRTHGVFKDGLMPTLPPKREWCNWDF